MKRSVIQVENLGKKYHIKKNVKRYNTLRESITDNLKSILTAQKEEATEFWPLRDVSFEVQHGDKVGIVGRNGAGKSTLLKLLSRITSPSEGNITLRGKVGSLLEVGTGFHPELTGKENIYLNGSILGMSRREINKKFDDIVEFAEISKFIETPVKRYSSGMYVRLAFSVAAHLEPDILIVDEILAVGDINFQKKCLGKLNETQNTDRTVLFVSHNMQAISSICNKGIYLANNTLCYNGNTETAIGMYINANSSSLSQNLFSGPLKEKIIFNSISINQNLGAGAVISPYDAISFEVSGISKVKLKSFRMAISIYKDDIRVCTLRDVPDGIDLREGKFVFKIEIPKNQFRPGMYSLSIGGRQNIYSDWINGKNVSEFVISEEWGAENELENEGIFNITHTGSRIQE